MKLGMIGLGRMGSNMTQRLIEGGHEVVGFDFNAAAVKRGTEMGMEGAHSLEELVSEMEPPRVAWLMVPAGDPVQATIGSLLSLMSPGDIVIDGGNSNFRDTLTLEARVRQAGMSLLDVGTSGGIWGLTEGYCLMIGGERAAFERIEPIVKTLAPPNGYAYVGPSGAGHFVKMVHNGIEYGMMQAYGEGFEILQRSQYSPDLAAIAKLWTNGSVVRSWLLELAADAFEQDPGLSSIKGYVEDTGEGRWTIAEAMALDVPAPVITLSLFERFHSRQPDSFCAKVLAALRQEFGGHAVKKANLP